MDSDLRRHERYAAGDLEAIVAYMYSTDYPELARSASDFLNLIRAYNAKDKMIKKKLNTQKVMYSYAVSAIRTALSHPDHWTERLLPTRTASEFGDNPQWETRIRQNITIQPESI